MVSFSYAGSERKERGYHSLQAFPVIVHSFGAIRVDVCLEVNHFVAGRAFLKRRDEDLGLSEEASLLSDRQLSVVLKLQFRSCHGAHCWVAVENG